MMRKATSKRKRKLQWWKLLRTLKIARYYRQLAPAEERADDTAELGEERHLSARHRLKTATDMTEENVTITRMQPTSKLTNIVPTASTTNVGEFGSHTTCKIVNQ